MLILRSSPASPFVRKIRIAASVLGLDREITIELADTANPGDTVRQQNPLGKIPALVLEDGMVLFDSRVILDYLDHRAGGGKIVPKDAAARFAALRLQALADGLMDASILLIYEGRWRSAERHEPKWVDHQAGKVARALASLEAAPPPVGRPAERGADRGRLRARLPRLSLRRDLAEGSSAPSGVARPLCRAGAGLRRDHPAAGVMAATPARRPPPSTPAMIDRVSAVRRRIQRLIYRAKRWRRQAVSPDLPRCLVVLRAGDQSLHPAWLDARDQPRRQCKAPDAMSGA
jgi:glutathione S-transferase